MYKQAACDAELIPYSKSAMRAYMKSSNYSLVTPKKDICDTCLAYRLGHIPEEEFEAHIKFKKAALEEKEKDKTTTPDTTLVVTEDTEGLLISPRNDSNAMFYRTKLNCHNLTYYNLKTKDSMNYLWTEVSGSLKAPVFTTIHIDYLEQAILQNPGTTEIIIHSDNCIYQNKNATNATALRRFAAKHGVVIIWKYLVVGHTFMEGDSVHRLIEDQLKGRDVNIPEDYVSVIKNARIKPCPYKVRLNSPLPYSFFKNYEHKQDITTIRPGTQPSDPTVNDLKAIRYSPDGAIHYKLHGEDQEFQPLQLGRKVDAPATDITYPPLYTSPRPIAFSKFQHLQELKPSIPAFFHRYYDDLPHHPAPVKKSKENKENQQKGRSKNKRKDSDKNEDNKKKRRRVLMEAEKKETYNENETGKMRKRRAVTAAEKKVETNKDESEKTATTSRNEAAGKMKTRMKTRRTMKTAETKDATNQGHKKQRSVSTQRKVIRK